MWDYYPYGFFPRLLVRLMHLQLPVPVSWANAAVILSKSGDEVALLQMKKEADKYCLEVSILKKSALYSLFCKIDFYSFRKSQAYHK